MTTESHFCCLFINQDITWLLFRRDLNISILDLLLGVVIIALGWCAGSIAQWQILSPRQSLWVQVHLFLFCGFQERLKWTNRRSRRVDRMEILNLRLSLQNEVQAKQQIYNEMTELKAAHVESERWVHLIPSKWMKGEVGMKSTTGVSVYEDGNVWQHVVPVLNPPPPQPPQFRIHKFKQHSVADS